MIYVNEPLLKGNEKKYLNECIDTGWISSEGPFVKRFEESFANEVGRVYAVAVANGTAALDIAIEALSIAKGDEVIIPSFTIISCANQIARVGAIPVLVDSDPVTWNMDTSAIEEKITSKTKAIMAVHIYGLPVDLDPILRLAKKHNLKVIEDAAQMIGQTYKGKPCGSFGDISTFSFYPNKHITSGEGGMVVTNDPELAKKSSELRNLCFKSNPRFVHENLGWNYRMTNMQAAIGLAQLEQLDGFIEKKREMGKLYSKGFEALTCLQLPLSKTEFAENIFWVYAMVLKDNVPFEAITAMQKLGELGIGTRPFFWGMHEQPILKKMGYFKNQSFPTCENISRRGFYIPSGLSLTKSHIEEVIDKVNEVFKQYC